MSILTKLFVVLATVLSLLLVALLVPFVQNSTTLKQQFDEVKTQRDVAQMQARTDAAELVRAQDVLTTATSRFEKEKQELIVQNDNLLTELSQKQDDLVSTRADLKQAQARQRELTSAQEQSAKIIAMLNDEVKTRRTDNLDLRTKNIALSNRVNELQTQNETLVQQIRLVKEQMFALQNEMEQAAEAVQSTAAPTEAAPVAADRPVRGMITDVRQVGEVTFVALNVGTNDQVRQGMEFMIHEGNRFMGNIVITKVDLNSAAGRVTLAQGPIKAEQEVLTGGF